MRERAIPEVLPLRPTARSFVPPEDVTDASRFDLPWGDPFAPAPSPESTTTMTSAWPLSAVDAPRAPSRPARPRVGPLFEAAPRRVQAPTDVAHFGAPVLSERGRAEISTVLDQLVESGDLEPYAGRRGTADTTGSSPLTGLAADPLPPALPSFPRFPASQRAPSPAEVAAAQRQLGLVTASSHALERSPCVVASAAGAAERAAPDGRGPAPEPAFHALLVEAERGRATPAPSAACAPAREGAGGACPPGLVPTPPAERSVPVGVAGAVRGAAPRPRGRRASAAPATAVLIAGLGGALAASALVYATGRLSAPPSTALAGGLALVAGLGLLLARSTPTR